MTLENLRAKTRFLLGDISSDNYSDTNLDRALNDYYMRGIAKAIQVNGQWEVKGTIATANIVDGQREYALPSTLVSLKMIEANLTGDEDTWRKLKIVDLRNLGAITNRQDDPNDDTEGESTIRIYDKSLYFLRPPKNSVTGGLKVYYSKEETELSGTSDEPSLAEHLHMYLVHGSCMDYSLRIDDTKTADKYRSLLLEDELNLEEYYTNRLPAVQPRIKPRVEKYN